jgi:anti-sigma factor RsiW
MVEVSCETLVELLGDYVDQRLAPDRRASLDAHLAACGPCSDLLRDYRAIPELVRRVTDEEVPARAESRLRRLLHHRRPPR